MSEDPIKTAHPIHPLVVFYRTVEYNINQVITTDRNTPVMNSTGLNNILPKKQITNPNITNIAKKTH
jgi:hypothetical protein